MSRYVSKIPPTNPQELSSFLLNELRDISRSLSEPDEFLVLDKLYKAPSKIREGMIVLADGTSWNPGSGAGFYGYRNGSWRLLG